MFLTQRQQMTRQCQPLLTFRRFCARPVEFRLFKGGDIVRIRHRFAVTGMAFKLSGATFTHRFSQIAVEIGKEQEWSGFAILFAHKQQRNVWRDQQHGQQHLRPLCSCQRDQPFALRAVARLVMVLDEVDKGDRRLAAALHTACLARLC